MEENIDLETIVNDPELLNMISEGSSEMAGFLEFCYQNGVGTVHCCRGHHYGGTSYIVFNNLDKRIVEKIYNASRPCDSRKDQNNPDDSLKGVTQVEPEREKFLGSLSVSSNSKLTPFAKYPDSVKTDKLH